MQEASISNNYCAFIVDDRNHTNSVMNVILLHIQLATLSRLPNSLFSVMLTELKS